MPSLANAETMLQSYHIFTLILEENISVQYAQKNTTITFTARL